MQELRLLKWFFAWVAAGQEHTLPIWEGRDHWQREQIGFLFVVMMQGAIFFATFVFSLWFGVWFGRCINFFGFLSTASIVLIARVINTKKWCTLAQTMDLLAGMQCTFICAMAIVLHVAWGGVETGRDNNAFLISSLGPLILLQVAGTYCPDNCSVHQASESISHRDRWGAARRTSISSVTSEDNDRASSDDESPRASTYRGGGAWLASAVPSTAARFSGRMAPMRWTAAIRAAGAVALALVDPVLVPVPATVRKPWMSGVWTVWVQLWGLAVHVKSTQVPPTGMHTLLYLCGFDFHTLVYAPP